MWIFADVLFPACLPSGESAKSGLALTRPDRVGVSSPPRTVTDDV
jgi:hypothetical protein